MNDSSEFGRGQLGFGAAAAAPSGAPTAGLLTGSYPLRLFATDAGTGRNVMLLHGWTAESNDWCWQLPLLESRYRTVAVDLRGHGRSEIAASGGYNPADYVADIERLIKDNFGGERFVLIGHSMGAQIAAQLAVKRPEFVDAVVSIDGALGFSAELEPVFQKAAADLREGDPATVASALFEAFYDNSTSSALRRWHARRAQGMPAHVIRESFGPLFTGDGQLDVGKNSELFLGRIRVPFYHMCRDAEQADRMRRWLTDPRSKVDVWRNAGHWIMQDRPDDVNVALLDWIDRL
ncbi:alpha/beta hydrolase [Bradyrhizobium sp. BR 10289]|uniref:alpha/beta fold hydrolase n=1 Tax=Bradyrhizobium sp. BR 10289 TaxID=2749993 RepID=UPI001C652A9E|nr:alpha/beta hydrolase [Bradyrhizobium sp. BR 10289]MBW7970224.1 alpha/beta hydrolase [Bradyrhizobium sp. BR 10289]